MQEKNKGRYRVKLLRDGWFRVEKKQLFGLYWEQDTVDFESEAEANAYVKDCLENDDYWEDGVKWTKYYG